MRILFSTWGSAGDLFPLIPIAEAARASGSEVLFACPRTLGLYLRALGYRSVALGSGHEINAVLDPTVYSTRFDGWASWRSTWERYVAPELFDTARACEKVIEEWRPDVVVTTTFAAAARIAAFRKGVPHQGLTIYPQHRVLEREDDRRFAPTFLAQVRHAAGAAALAAHGLAASAWGLDNQTLLLHDPCLLGFAHQAGVDRAVGFPYWDASVASAASLDLAQEWLDADHAPVVVVTLGSFVGLHQKSVLKEAAAAAARAGCRGLVVGAPRDLQGPSAQYDADVLGIPFVPLSQIVGRARVVIHHGGIGTTFAALRAGRPAIVLPQSYDQPFNAQLIENAKVGFDGSGRDLAGLIEWLLNDETTQARSQAASRRLITTDEVTKTVLRAARAEVQ